MGLPNEYIIQHPGKQKECCIVQHLFSEEVYGDQTSYNKVQHDSTQSNKVAKRAQHFIQHQFCMMLYEMLYSFGRGLKLFGLFQKEVGLIIQLDVVEVCNEEYDSS